MIHPKQSYLCRAPQDAVIHVYDAAGNVIEMNGHAGDFTSREPYAREKVAR